MDLGSSVDIDLSLAGVASQQPKYVLYLVYNTWEITDDVFLAHPVVVSNTPLTLTLTLNTYFQQVNMLLLGRNFHA